MIEPNLYAAPAGDRATLSPARFLERAGYHDQSGLLNLLKAALAILFLMDAANAATILSLIYLFEITPDSAVLQGQLVNLSATLVQLALWGFYLVYIPFGVFLVRANKNARSFSPELPYSPASMVWWFAIPFANLIKPYHAVRSVWEASHPSGDPDFSAGRVLGFWWFMWLANSFVSRFLTSMAEKLDEKAVTAYNVLSLLTNFLSLGLYVAAFCMLRALHVRQRRRASED